ncbi:hypothetical protein niasHT_026600 [Heterodera trifolii]|uniref:C2H2-type domain-containing protein n=1 Tax=Heterodera trifolii TaxID=157864 RepID=A0ABD2KSA3_9BILA
MLSNKHCEVITLSDDDGGQQQLPMMAQQVQRHQPRQHGLQKSEYYGDCQTSNIAAIPNGRLPANNQLHPRQQQQAQMQRQTLAQLLKAENGQSTVSSLGTGVISKNVHLPLQNQRRPCQQQPTQTQRQMLAELLKVENGATNDTKMGAIQQQKQRFVQPTAGGGGVTMAIMQERPLDMTALNKPNCNYSALPPPPKNSKITVKEQLVMYFQQQQKVQMQQLHATSSSNGSKENGGIPRPLSNGGNSFDHAALKRRLATEWHPQFNIPLLTTKPEMATTRNNKFTNGKLHLDTTKSFFNTYVEAYNRKTTNVGFNVVEEEFTGQFLCTFQSCNKRLRNNVMFMHHIWAHVAMQKPMESDEQFTNLHLLMAEQHNANNGTDTAIVDEQRSDVSRLLMCPECLLEQPTPYRARLHYHRVHKRGMRPLLDNKPGLNVCNICEQVIDTNNIALHCAGHHLSNNRAQLALPYGCRFGAGVKCQFRASNRGALLRHFCLRHVGTHVLLCPFCLLTFPVPPADKRCSVVRMREFVKHMALHDGEKSLCCQLCVVKFPFSQRLLMGTHKEQQHTKHNDGEPKWLQWQMQRMDLKALVPDKSRALVSSDLGIPQCVECGQMVHCLARHLGKERRRCSFCAFVTRCAPAMERHRLLSKCNAAAKATRTPFPDWTSSITFAHHKANASVASPPSSSSPLASIVRFSCLRCSAFRSVNVKALAEHIAKVHVHQMPFPGGVRVRLLPNTENNGRPMIQSAKISSINGEQQKNLIAVVEQHLEQYTKDIIKEGQREAELFGLRHIGDGTPLEEKQRVEQAANDNDKNAGDESQTLANSAETTNEQREAMHEWLSTFLPLLHANKLDTQCANQPQSESTRLFMALKAQDDAREGNDDGTAAAPHELLAKQHATVEEESSEFRIRMGLLLDSFTYEGSSKTVSEKRTMKDGCLKAEPKEKSIRKSH